MVEHPITPPPELTQEWSCDCPLTDPFSREFYVATQAARWGADQELEACLTEIRDGAGRIYIDETKFRVCLADDIWTARRPYPPSLKEQALDELQFSSSRGYLKKEAADTIRRALESLPS